MTSRDVNSAHVTESDIKKLVMGDTQSFETLHN